MTSQPKHHPEIPQMASEVFTMSVERVTPEMAREWLKLNTRNRNLRHRRAEQIRQDCLDGQWKFDGMPIRFGTSGKLLDGQHRLSAIAGINDHHAGFPIVVMRGIPEESQFVMDQGSKRTAADQLGLDGIRNAPLIASGVKFYLIVRAGLLYSDRHKWEPATTISKIREFVHENPWVIDAAENLNRYFSGKDYPFTPSKSFAVALMTWQVNPEATVHYFSALKHGGVGINHPANRLRNWGLARGSAPISTRDEIGLLIEHWNKISQGQSLKRAPMLYVSEPPAGRMAGATKKSGKWTRFDDPANFPSVHGLNGSLT